ncbi:MAG: beta-ketoacyl-ACP synthase II [Cyclobacteriaceae bacterium]|nr:beta-ketoacyl-ACP synthase II [Cyclobacteriaceae bacterium]
MARVVVTGVGVLSPIGNNINDFWGSMLSGKSGAAPITYFDASKFKTRFACELKGFDPTNFLDRQEIKRYDPFTQYALVAVNESIVNANLDLNKIDKYRCGVIWASGNGGVSTNDDQLLEFAKGDGTPRFSPFYVPRILIDIASGVISIKHGLKGINYTAVSACASATTAIINAFHYIKWGKADLLIAGGSEAPITESTIGGFNALKALSTKNDSPETASQPFDIARDGFVMGEGAGSLILESYEHAVKRNAPILAEIVGGGMTADAWHLTATHPDGEGAERAMKECLSEAGIQPEDVQYINAHATSTPTGDASELKAIERVFGERKSLIVNATKSMTGHLLGATGAVEAIASIKVLKENIVPPTINTQNPEPEFADKFNFVLGKSKNAEVNYALSNTFGFGGHIASILFKKYQ